MSPYGAIARPAASELPLPLQIESPNGTISIQKVVPTDTSTLSVLHSTMNHIIVEGKTYPHKDPLSLDEFKDYFTSHDAFYASLNGKVLGGFYVKPNFPGRCSHICNGGFIVVPNCRGLGVGTALGKAFLILAPKCGYDASLFNLVFVSNEPSVKLWRRLGFKEVGLIPKAGQLVGHPEGVDAIMFYYDFSTLSSH